MLTTAVHTASGVCERYAGAYLNSARGSSSMEVQTGAGARIQRVGHRRKCHTAVSDDHQVTQVNNILVDTYTQSVSTTDTRCRLSQLELDSGTHTLQLYTVSVRVSDTEWQHSQVRHGHNNNGGGSGSSAVMYECSEHVTEALLVASYARLQPTRADAGSGDGESSSWYKVQQRNTFKEHGTKHVHYSASDKRAHQCGCHHVLSPARQQPDSEPTPGPTADPIVTAPDDTVVAYGNYTTDGGLVIEELIDSDNTSERHAYEPAPLTAEKCHGSNGQRRCKKQEHRSHKRNTDIVHNEKQIHRSRTESDLEDPRHRKPTTHDHTLRRHSEINLFQDPRFWHRTTPDHTPKIYQTEELARHKQRLSLGNWLHHTTPRRNDRLHEPVSHHHTSVSWSPPPHVPVY